MRASTEQKAAAPAAGKGAVAKSVAARKVSIAGQQAAAAPEVLTAAPPALLLPVVDGVLEVTDETQPCSTEHERKTRTSLVRRMVTSLHALVKSHKHPEKTDGSWTILDEWNLGKALDALSEKLGTDLLVYHGWSEIWLDDRWLGATPAFNKELCERLGVAPLEFDGEHDAVFQEYDRSGVRFMEYVEDHGPWDHVPLQRMFEAWAEHYPAVRDRKWPKPTD